MKKIIPLLFIAFATLLMPNMAMAQTADEQARTYFTPAEHDQSLQYLGKVLGDLGTNSAWVSSDKVSPLLGMFEVFNHIILIFAIFVVLYTLIVATLNTAHHGKMMGERWSSMWVPIRVVLGFGMLLPKAGGFALIQSLVMWLVIQSVGAADSIWNVMVDRMEFDNQATPSAYIVKKDSANVMNAIIRPIVEAQWCSIDKKTNVKTYEENLPDGMKKFVIDFDKSQCGFLSFTSDPARSIKKPDGSIGTLDPVYDRKKAVLQRALPALRPVAEFFHQLPTSYTQKEVLERTSHADAVILAGAVIQVVVDYNKQVSDGIVESLEKRDQNKTDHLTEDGIISKERLKKEGWVFAGSYYSLLAKQISASDVEQPLDMVLQNSVKQTNYIWPLSLKQINTKFNNLYNISSQVDDAQMRSVLVALHYLNKVTECSDATKTCEFLKPVNDSDRKDDQSQNYRTIGSEYLQKAREYMIRSDYTAGELNLLKIPKSIWNARMREFITMAQVDLLDGQGDPLEELIAYGQSTAREMGHQLKRLQDTTAGLGGTEAVLGGVARGTAALAGGMAGGMLAPATNVGLSVASTVASAVHTAVKVPYLIVTAQLPFAMAVIGAFFVQAAMLGIYVPMIPYVMFAFGALGWMIMAIEAMVAAPIVALGATIPEGNEVYGKAVPALMLVSNVFLRPMLMLFGLYAGVLLANVSIEYFTHGFDTLFMRTFTDNGGPPNILYWMVIVFIYSSLLVFLLQKCFSMVSALPERVLRWIGDTSQGITGGEEALHELRGAAQRGGESTSQQASEAQRGQAQATSQGSEAAQSGAQGVGQGIHMAGREAQKQDDGLKGNVLVEGQAGSETDGND